MGVGIGKFLINLGVRNILAENLHGQGACSCLNGCMFCFITIRDSIL